MRKGIVTFAFGEDPDSRINRLIGEITNQQSIVLNASVFTQNDISLFSERVDVTRAKQGKHEEPPPTLRIAREAA